MHRSKRFKERSTASKIEYVIRGHKVFWVKHRVTCRSRSKNHYEKRMLVGSTYYCVYFEILHLVAGIRMTIQRISLEKLRSITNEQG